MKRIAVSVGTVPEAVKLGPVCRELLAQDGAVRTHVILSGQHPQRVAPILGLFGVSAHATLADRITRDGLAPMAGSLLGAIAAALRPLQPDLVVVQGDTATALAGGMAAFYAGIPVAHVEAGLTTRNVAHPFPEELHREVISRLATLLFAPSERSASHARSVARPGASVFCTGNPVVDALVAMLESQATAQPPGRDGPARKQVLVTVHRRENHGARGLAIAGALKRLAEDRPEAEVIFVGHPHPALAPIAEFLRRSSPVRVLPPQEYVAWLTWLRACHFLISDSGGAQEEAPWLGKPLLIPRDETERPEVLEAGAAKLVGSDPERIYQAAAALLDDPAVYRRMRLDRAAYPYGHGTAAPQIVGHLLDFLKTPEPSGRTVPETLAFQDAEVLAEADSRTESLAATPVTVP